MAIIGTICPYVPGHLNPLTTLCRELQRRGHRVIFYQLPLAAEKIRSRCAARWAMRHLSVALMTAVR